MSAPLARRVASEALGTALLLATVVGSGIMGESLADGSVAIALLANTIATGAILIALIAALGSTSGAHLNPSVTLAMALAGALAWRDVAPYVVAQLLGALAGVAAAHVMFELPVVSLSTHVRTGSGQWFAELVATFGLLATVFGCARTNPERVPLAVGAYIVAGYWFTASTSFANPAVTVARAFTETFAGIRAVDVPAFVVAQILGALLAAALFRWLIPLAKESA
ncbi:MAG: aquaporin [Sandaracinaceae bacterium]